MADDTKGRFCWYDLMTTDVEASKAFYTKVIGWEIDRWKDDQPYELWKGPKGPVGGVMVLPEEAKKMGAPPHWMPYVATADIDASLEQAKRMGANVLVPATDIPEVGKFAVMADPQGAAIAMFMGAGETPGHDDDKVAGEVSWHELATTDLEAATGFYGEMFGWQKTEDMDMGPMGIYRMFGRGAAPLGGMMNKPSERPGPAAWLCYFKVDDVKAKVKEAEALGAKVLNGPMEVPGGDIVAQLMDPQGVAFALHGK